MKEETLRAIRESYDRVAGEYARRMFSELDNKPLDRELLSRLAGAVNGKGEICDIGCGPGHIARFLRDQGANVFGIDLSLGMLEQARRLNPDISFRQGNMLALELPDASLAAISAFYAIVHLPPGAVPQASREMARVLKPGGLLLLSFHIGEETVHRDEWLDRPVTLDFRFFSPQAIESDLETAGLVIQETIEREPYAPEVEHQSRRAYIFARKP
ncbi:MAG TPA: methyltransferase domain-containing protein [Acidobacteriaceae bacterium]